MKYNFDGLLKPTGYKHNNDLSNNAKNQLNLIK